MKEHPNFLVLLWGPPASGKSHLARLLRPLFKERYGLELCHLGTDRLNQAILDEHFDSSLRPILYDNLLNLALDLLLEGRSVLIEGTFLRGSWRKQLQKELANESFPFLSVQVNCRLGLLKQRNCRRPSSQRVPEEFLCQAHRSAQEQAAESDFVFDSELLKPEGLARYLLGELMALSPA